MTQVEIIANKAISDLMEHCDAVVILCSITNEDNQTESLVNRSGNYHAQLGLVQAFKNRELEKGVVDEIQERTNEK